MPVPTDSTSDLLVSYDQSDMESSTSTTSSDESAPKDYWFGRKCFEYVIAQDVLQHSRLHETVAQVDSRLESIIQGFPYAHSLTELRKRDLGPLLPVVDDIAEDGAYKAMMFSIGAVFRSGDHAQRATLLNVLRRHISAPEHPGTFRSHADDDDDEDDDDDYVTEEETARPLPQQARQRADVEVLPPADTGRFATALKEHGDQVGFTPVYEVTELSRGTPSFRASVLVDGSTCEGIASSKKQARHEAAKRACRIMEIEA